MSEASTDPKIEGLIAEVQSRPGEFALFCDLDGTLAPIVERPEQVEISASARDALVNAAENLGLCAVVTGRPALEARQLVGLDTISYAGNHGIELLQAGSDQVRAHPLLTGHEGDAAAFLDSVQLTELQDLGIRIEDKGAIVALHWRGNQTSGELEHLIQQISDRAKANGLEPRGGRMVLELRPGVAIDKGVAVTELLEGAAGITSAIFFGDDLTDLDAFAALDQLVAASQLKTATKVAVLSSETSDLGLTDNADICLEGPAEVADLIREIAD